jgi:hypothetical protein
MKKEHLAELIEISEQLKHLQDLYAVEVDWAREALKRNELDEDELEYKSVETMNYFINKFNDLVEEIIKEQNND